MTTTKRRCIVAVLSQNIRLMIKFTRQKKRNRRMKNDLRSKRDSNFNCVCQVMLIFGGAHAQIDVDVTVKWRKYKPKKNLSLGIWPTLNWIQRGWAFVVVVAKQSLSNQSIFIARSKFNDFIFGAPNDIVFSIASETIDSLIPVQFFYSFNIT